MKWTVHQASQHTPADYYINQALDGMLHWLQVKCTVHAGTKEQMYRLQKLPLQGAVSCSAGTQEQFALCKGSGQAGPQGQRVRHGIHKLPGQHQPGSDELGDWHLESGLGQWYFTLHKVSSWQAEHWGRLSVTSHNPLRLEAAPQPVPVQTRSGDLTQGIGLPVWTVPKLLCSTTTTTTHWQAPWKLQPRMTEHAKTTSYSHHSHCYLKSWTWSSPSMPLLPSSHQSGQLNTSISNSNDWASALRSGFPTLSRHALPHARHYQHHCTICTGGCMLGDCVATEAIPARLVSPCSDITPTVSSCLYTFIV